MTDVIALKFLYERTIDTSGRKIFKHGNGRQSIKQWIKKHDGFVMKKSVAKR